jgi:hypothetical protein
VFADTILHLVCRLAHKRATSGGIAGLVGLLVTLFLAFLIGGYVAGRMASRSGLKQL